LAARWAGVNLLFLANLVLFIWVLVVMFQNGKTGLGIASIITSLCCGIGSLIAFFTGWAKSGEWKIRPLMLIWTLALVAYLALSGYQGAQLAPVVTDTFKKIDQIQKEQINKPR
jgi:uncharacterized membrane protein